MTAHSEKTSGMDSFKKWLGLVAAVLSLGSAAYGLLHAQAEKQERAGIVDEKLQTGRLQEKSGDYAQAWDSFQEAARVAGRDGMLSKLVGGLSRRQEEAHTALQQVAMEWLRDAHGQNNGFSESANNAIKMLAADAGGATGARKADLLAHLGYAYFLKARAEEPVSDPLPLYREAVAADARNPFANAFWGHLILWKGNGVEEAKQHFAAAVASGRERAVVRRFQLAAYSNRHSEESDAAWWQAVDEMHKAGEPLDDRTLSDMGSRYYFAVSHKEELSRLFAAVPPADHVELARMLMKSGKAEGNVLSEKVALAESLDAAGRGGEALAAWQDLQKMANGEPTTFDARMKEAIKRLGGRHP